MNVQQAIEMLNQVENKLLPICITLPDSNIHSPFKEISSINIIEKTSFYLSATESKDTEIHNSSSQVVVLT